MSYMSREPKTPYAVLGVLSLGDMSGYEISGVLEKSVGHFWRESFGQLYPTLRRLEEEALISSHPAPGIKGPERKVHSLTADGWKALRDWLARPADIHDLHRDETLLKTFFGRHAPGSAPAEHIRRRKELLDGLLRTYEQIEDELAQDPSPDRPYWLITVRHGIHLTTAMLAWCEETLAQLETLEQT